MIEHGTSYSSLLSRSRIDRHHRLEPENVLEKLGTRKQPRLAAAGRDDLNADGKGLTREAGRNRDRWAANERRRMGDGEPVDIIVETVAVAFCDVALLDREWRDDGGRAEQQIIGFEEVAHPVEHGAALGFGAGDLRGGECE